jgi:hypothetical protein
MKFSSTSTALFLAMATLAASAPGGDTKLDELVDIDVRFPSLSVVMRCRKQEK